MSKKPTTITTCDGREIVARCSVKSSIVAPRKMKLVCDLVRGKTCGQALEILRYTHRPSAVPVVTRAIRSAMANASRTVAEPLELVVGEVLVEGARIDYRFTYATRGRAVRIRKRRSHIHVRLTEK